jgi:ADP-ribose pyrophosphatase YjhB (NUDIX family)
MIRRGGVGEYASDGHGTWSMPGGWLERGETAWDAAEREVLEETGCRVTAYRDLGFVCCASESAPVQIVTLVIGCRWDGGEPTVTEPEKCPEVRFVTFPELNNLPLFAPVRAWRKKGGLT